MAIENTVKILESVTDMLEAATSVAQNPMNFLNDISAVERIIADVQADMKRIDAVLPELKAMTGEDEKQLVQALSQTLLKCLTVLLLFATKKA